MSERERHFYVEDIPSIIKELQQISINK